MNKIFNSLIILLFFSFFYISFNYYSSKKNLKIKEFNLNNINQIINEKISNLTVLPNDTNNIIEFNNSITSEIKNEKPRSFWNLLKLK